MKYCGMRIILKLHCFFVIALWIANPWTYADGLETDFRTPPESARPGTYWIVMDGNQQREEMVKDLRAMRDVGIGSVSFMEVDLDIPRGPISFMSEAWQDNIANAFVEAGNLGMEVVLLSGPGWAGSGGSWVGIDDSMQHLVGSSLKVNGPGTLNQVLPVPPPHSPNPYAGMNGADEAQRNSWFKDVAVIAFPSPGSGTAMVDDINIKTLKDILPYSIRNTNKLFVRSSASYPEPNPSQVIDQSRAVDLTSLLQPDGRITWNIPAGNWTIMRFVSRGTGQTTRPAPQSGHGFECNKFDGASYRRHWDNFQKKLLDRVVSKGGPLQPGKGLTTIHLDSWEMSSQNWSGKFRQEFQSRRGYNPLPFYPTWMGQVVGSREKTERFLWDLRKTSQELVLDEHAGKIKQLAHENGLLYSNQPYDMNPAGNLDLGSLADIPSCEFWSDTVDTQYSCIEAVSISHTMGQQIVKAEAFTAASSDQAFANVPANMKNQTDWAFAMGINGFVFSSYVHQPLGSTAMPGMTFGTHGIQWHRNMAFWNFLPDYHEYITRCSHILRQGEAVADVLYLTPEGAPHIFEPPADALEGISFMRDKKGFAFDAVTPRILAMRAVVENGRIAFPNGSKYRVLVLPDVPTMTPETLAKIQQLVQAGATVIGNPPSKSPSLVNYPTCDSAVSALAGTMWSGTVPPAVVTRINLGGGAIYWGGNLDPATDLYPSHTATAAVLTGLGLAEDFSSTSGKLRYCHRQTADRDIYFVSNRTAEKVVTQGCFRIEGLSPYLWDPLTGETRVLEDYKTENGLTRMPLAFEPQQSFFVVFPHNSAGTPHLAAPKDNFSFLYQVARLDGAWEVAFNPALGGTPAITFSQLIDWTQRPEEGIRYYSGIATYRKTFALPESALTSSTFLDLGTVRDICRVRLNGQDLGTVWTAPWRVDITGVGRATGNQLEIEVVNSWVNRLIGDQHPANKGVRTLAWPSGLLSASNYPAGRYTFATHNHFNASSPLRPAGLIGPVSILVPNVSGGRATFQFRY
jgi:alpha-L-rhamnosidase